jgi:hypothetical protein
MGTQEKLVMTVPEAGELLGISRAQAVSDGKARITPCFAFGEAHRHPKSCLDANAREYYYYYKKQIIEDKQASN